VCQSGPDVAAYPVLLPPTLGKHVEQNVSLATSSDARLRRPVRVTVLRRADVCAFEPGSAPRKHAPPKAMYPRRLMGVWGVYRATRPIPGRIFGAAATVHHGEIRCQSLMPLVRSAYRSGYSPDNRNNKLGFRVARAQRVRWTLCRTEPIAHRVPAPRRRANTRFRPSGAGSEPRRLRAAFPFRFQAGGVRRASRDQYTFKSLSLDEHAPFIRIGTNSSPTSASRPQRRAVEEHESFRKRFEENLIKTL
jgi:hypothetical protein